MSAWKVGAMNAPSCSTVGLRNTGAVSRMKSFQNWPGTSGSSGGGASRMVRSSKPFSSRLPANDCSTMNTTRWPRPRSTSPMPTQLLVGPKAPSGKNATVLIQQETLMLWPVTPEQQVQNVTAADEARYRARSLWLDQLDERLTPRGSLPGDLAC